MSSSLFNLVVTIHPLQRWALTTRVSVKNSARSGPLLVHRHKILAALVGTGEGKDFAISLHPLEHTFNECECQEDEQEGKKERSKDKEHSKRR